MDILDGCDVILVPVVDIAIAEKKGVRVFLWGFSLGSFN